MAILVSINLGGLDNYTSIHFRILDPLEDTSVTPRDFLAFDDSCTTECILEALEGAARKSLYFVKPFKKLKRPVSYQKPTVVKFVEGIKIIPLIERKTLVVRTKKELTRKWVFDKCIAHIAEKKLFPTTGVW